MSLVIIGAPDIALSHFVFLHVHGREVESSVEKCQVKEVEPGSWATPTINLVLRHGSRKHSAEEETQVSVEV